VFNLKDTCNIKGYDKIPINAKMFENFLKNFLAQWGTEARETIIPESVKFTKDKSGSYLRFDYIIYGRKEWLHVINANTWY
jgi:hypothetical protein